jgi:hypothetical protein
MYARPDWLDLASSTGAERSGLAETMIGGWVRADAVGDVVGLSVHTSAVTSTTAMAAAVVSRSFTNAAARLLFEILYLPRNARLRYPGAHHQRSELGHR